MLCPIDKLNPAAVPCQATAICTTFVIYGTTAGSMCALSVTLTKEEDNKERDSKKRTLNAQCFCRHLLGAVNCAL